MKRIMSVLVLALSLAPLGAAQAAKPDYSRTTEPKRLVEVPVPPSPGPVWPGSETRRDLKIDVWVDGGDNATFFTGQTVTLHFRTNRDAYVLLYDIDTQGNVQRLYPRSSADEQRVEGGVIYTVPNLRAGYRLVASGPEGYEYVGAVASETPLVGRWDRTSGRISNGRDDGFRGTRLESQGRIGVPRDAAMDQLYAQLVEVPVGSRGGRARTAHDEVRFYISHPIGRRGR